MILALGVCRSPSRGGAKKDTLQNIEETKCVVGKAQGKLHPAMVDHEL